MSYYQPTEEQFRIINAVKDFEAPVLKVLAFAGTGKTSTLVDAAKSISGRKLYLAFNKSIQLEAEIKFSNLNTVVKTTHSLAYGYIVKPKGFKIKNSYAIREIENLYHCSYYVAKKTKEYFENFCNGADDIFQVTDGDDIQKQSISKALDLAEQFFNDMVEKKISMLHSAYLKLFEMELRHGNLKITPYRLIMLDEAQDTNDVTLSIFYHLTGEQRLAVGDRHQQIYSFRGSVNAMNQIKSKTYNLTNSFRFPKSIGEKATEFLKIFRHEPLTLIGRGEEKKENQNDTKAYITRSNARLIAVFSEHMMDRKYIKPVREPNAIFGLALNMNRLKDDKLEHIDAEFKYLKTFMYDFKKLDDREQSKLHDIFGYIQSIIHDKDDEHIRTIKLLENYKDIESIYNFAVENYNNPQQAFLFATTAHTSKGLEWNHVVIEDDFPDWYTIVKWYQKIYKGHPKNVPNPFQFFVENCKEQEFIDELNLYYVAITRGMNSVDDRTKFNKLPKHGKDYDNEIIQAYPKNEDEKDDRTKFNELPKDTKDYESEVIKTYLKDEDKKVEDTNFLRRFIKSYIKDRSK